ncbi:MAG: hypothetical protein KatS3mg109_1007 [Pirellulaceae bacterium]|nr:MAG: hypothetical protein KatS3mg109_1007 [Pirellulaceae bacterium]
MKKPVEHEGEAFLNRLLSRLASQHHQVRLSSFQWLALVSVATLLVALGMIWSLLSRPQGPSPAERLKEAFQALELHDYQTARRLADELRVADLDYHELAGPVFIQAAALRHDAQEHWNPAEKRKLYLIASRYFEESRDRGWPQGREAEGWYYLAETLVRAGRYAESLHPLQRAMELNPSRRSALDYLAAEAYRSLVPPDYAKAAEHLRRYAADRQLPPVDRAKGQLLLARMLLASAQDEEAQSILNEVFDTADQAAKAEGTSRQEQSQWATILRDAQILQARLWLRQADRQPDRLAELYDQAIQSMEALAAASQETPESEYLLAELYARRGDTNRLMEQLERMASRNYGKPEGQAAAVWLAELWLEQGRPAKAVDYVLTATEQKPETMPEYVPAPEQLRSRMAAVYRILVERKQFGEAERLVPVLPLLMPRAEALQQQAAAAVAWAEQLWEQAGREMLPQSATLEQQAAAQFAKAAALYEELTRLHYADRHYTDRLWQAAEFYLKGRRYRKAADLLGKYLQEEPRHRRARALLWLGEAMLALGRFDDAARHFEHCYAAYRNDPDAYRARVRAAQALIELGKWQQAEQVLEENLEHEMLAPDSAEWRDSLFLLAQLSHRQAIVQLNQTWDARWIAHQDANAAREVEATLEKAAPLLEKAIARWTEWVKRYPDDPRILEAWYTLACDHRYAALLPAWRYRSEVIQSQRRALAEQVQDHYRTALKIYTDLAARLEQTQDQRPLSALEKRLQRNAFFLKAHTLFDMGDYRAALDAYSTASNRYQNDPVCLEAFQQIAACYRLLGEPDKARGTREQARIVANSLPDDVDYTRTTRYPREVWLDLLK